jgi:RNA polymerase sigma-32 factor
MLISLNGQNNLGRYLSEVYRIPLLTIDEEIMYAKLKGEGDLNSAKMLVSSHLRLVVKIASKYQNYGLPMMDMISEGNLGLMKAVKDFDLSKGCRLATYAIWWIMASIQDFILRSWSLVKVGTTAAQKKLFFNLNKIKNKIMDHSQRDLNNGNVKYIANTLNVSEGEVLDMNCRLFKKDIYLNDKTTGKEETDREIIELLPSKDNTPETTLANIQENLGRRDLLESGLGILNAREKEVIVSRWLRDKPMTLRELSTKYGVSGERIRQIEESSLKKIQNYVTNKISKRSFAAS